MAGAARCVAPPMLVSERSTVRVDLVFDGRSTPADTSVPLQFTYYASPMVSSVAVPLAPVEGGVPMTLYGHGFGSLSNDSRLTVCGFGTADQAMASTTAAIPAALGGAKTLPIGAALPSAAAAAPHSLGLPYDAIAPASRLADGGLRCIAPSAGSAHATASDLRLEFGLRSSSPDAQWRAQPLQQASLLLQGRATSLDGELRLTNRSHPHEIGSAWVLPLAPHPPLTHFALSAEVRLNDAGTGGDGISICYSPPTAATFGELGPEPPEAEAARRGLVVRLRTRNHQRAELRLNGSLLASAATGPALRGSSFVPLRVEVDPASGVSVSFDSVALFVGVALPPSWLHMPQASWRIGLGGRLAQARTSSASTAHSAPRLKAWALRRARERGQKQGVCGCIGTR